MSVADSINVAPPRTPAAGRLSDAEALDMLRDGSLHDLGRRAFARSLALHPEDYRTYVVDRNINYANVCTAKCIFCNFFRKPGHREAYILSYQEIGQKIEELLAIGGTQILMQGGLVPAEGHASGHGLPFSWYTELLRYIRRHYPTIHIHAFSPPEIWAFHQIYGMPLRDVLLRLQDAGLATIPGGGGEILVDRVRRKIGQGKTLSNEWLEVMRQAHLVGMKTSCTMMFGHIETLAERIEHLRRLRDVQDETGGFTAFIHWPFQPEGTPLGRWKTAEEGAGIRDQGAEVRDQGAEVRDQGAEVRDQGAEVRDQGSGSGDRGTGKQSPSGSEGPPSRRREGAVSDANGSGADPHGQGTVAHGASNRGALPILSGGPAVPDASALAALSYEDTAARREPDGEHLFLADAHAYLKLLAVARLYLDNIPNIQSSWVTMGPKVGQLALFFGANDMGSVMMEENVVSAAGTTFRLNEPEIRRLIADAGWTPRKRNQYYEPLD